MISDIESLIRLIPQIKKYTIPEYYEFEKDLGDFMDKQLSVIQQMLEFFYEFLTLNKLDRDATEKWIKNFLSFKLNNYNKDEMKSDENFSRGIDPHIPHLWLQKNNLLYGLVGIVLDTGGMRETLLNCSITHLETSAKQILEGPRDNRENIEKSKIIASDVMNEISFLSEKFMKFYTSFMNILNSDSKTLSDLHVTCKFQHFEVIYGEVVYEDETLLKIKGMIKGDIEFFREHIMEETNKQVEVIIDDKK